MRANPAAQAFGLVERAPAIGLEDPMFFRHDPVHDTNRRQGTYIRSFDWRCRLQFRLRLSTPSSQRQRRRERRMNCLNTVEALGNLRDRPLSQEPADPYPPREVSSCGL